MRLSKMKLRRLYPSEASSHKNMLQRAPKLGHFVNPAWNKFHDFLLDMGPKPEPKNKYELDRIKTADPEYGPGKCRWANDRVQNNNKSDTLVFVHSVSGAKFTASELAKRQGVTVSAIQKRRSRNGWTPDEIIDGGRRAAFAQVSTPNSTPGTQSASDVLATASKPARSPNDKLADYWEFMMRELTPEDTAPLTGRERGQLAQFGEYLNEASFGHDKKGITEFILRNWADACESVVSDSGWSRPPAKPSPDFLANHARHFVNYANVTYKREDISKLQFANDDKLTPPAKPPSAPESAFQQRRRTVEAYREKHGEEYCLASLEDLNDLTAGCGSTVTEEQYVRKFASWWPVYKPHVVLTNLPEWAQNLISEIDPTPERQTSLRLAIADAL
jgi:hypothetical protein